MSSIKILLAAAMIMFASTALGGCSNAAEPSAAGIARIQEAARFRKSVNLQLIPTDNATSINLQVVLNNPEQRPVSSAEVWLTYNPDLLKGLEVNTDSSAFELMAPYENGFDHDLGLIKLGRSTSTPVQDTSMVLAELSFEKLDDSSAMIEAYNYAPDSSGHNSVNIIVDGEVFNILLKPESPLTIIQ